MKRTSSYFSLFFVVFALVLVVTLSACGPKSAPAQAEPDFDATLQAVYAEKTLQALASAAAPQSPPATAEPAVEPATQAPAPQPAGEALKLPGDPPSPDRTLEDANSSYFAEEHKATQGDNILNLQFERPFTANEMIYQPDLDIVKVDFAPGEDYFYFTIHLFGKNVQQWGLNGWYGIEFDRELKGRGDLLVIAQAPGEDWSNVGVTALIDWNNDVGGPQPTIADEGFDGDGYDREVELTGDKAAFARLDPEDENAIQIAVSYALLEYPEKFLWGAWADNGVKDVTMFDYNDAFGPGAAGSPIKGADWPVKALFNLDNTCRLPYGFEQSGGYPGMCKIGTPVAEKTDKNCQEYCYVFGERIVCYKVCK